MTEEPGEGWVEVGKLDEFPPGRGTEVKLGPRRIGIFRDGDQLHALKNICPHQGESLHLLPIRDGAAICVGHGWRFELTSGRCLLGEEWARVARYPVEVRAGRVFVQLG